MPKEQNVCKHRLITGSLKKTGPKENLFYRKLRWLCSRKTVVVDRIS